jgi:transcriptional regulator with XRE-family HTH domain
LPSPKKPTPRRRAGNAAPSNVAAENHAVAKILDDLDSARAAAGLTKGALATAAGLPEASVRKLLTSRTANPAFKTLFRLATPLGLELTLNRRDDGAAGELDDRDALAVED